MLWETGQNFLCKTVVWCGTWYQVNVQQPPFYPSRLLKQFDLFVSRIFQFHQRFKVAAISPSTNTNMKWICLALLATTVLASGTIPSFNPVQAVHIGFNSNGEEEKAAAAPAPAPEKGVSGVEVSCSAFGALKIRVTRGRCKGVAAANCTVSSRHLQLDVHLCPLLGDCVLPERYPRSLRRLVVWGRRMREGQIGGIRTSRRKRYSCW